MLAGGFADRLQRVGSAAALVQRVHPVGEAGDERLEAGHHLIELAEQRLRRLVEAVGADRGVDVRLQQLELVGHVVVGRDHLVGGAAVVGGRGPWIDGAHAQAVERGDDAVDVGPGLLHRRQERARLERLVEVGHAPARELVERGVGRGHRRASSSGSIVAR